jgi:class 3 adenylate cyclase/CHASE2 domain-containing sensor protein
LCGSGFFVFLAPVKLKPFKRVPVLVAASVIALACLASWLRLDSFERLERMTFDMRARAAVRYHPTVATNLGFVFINEESVKRVWNGSVGLHFGLLWPRQVYGRVVQELSLQNAKAAAFDIIFGELRPDHSPVNMADGSLPDSDEFFALQMRQASNVILALTPDVIPPPLFLTNVLALGDIATEKDPDGILRQAKAFRVYTNWHAAFRQMEADPDYDVDLRQARIQPRQIVLPRAGLEDVTVPLDAEGNFDLADFWGENLPAGLARKAKPFTRERVWHMGVVLAAQELKLDLAKADVDLTHGRITLPGPGGLNRAIPVDAEGYFFINWCMPENHPQLTREAIHDLLGQYQRRLKGETNGLVNRWGGKLVVVGSSAVVGNNLTDRGATPLSRDTLLVSKHWNVANSILTGRFVRRAPLGLELGLILLLGIVAAVATWQLRVLLASGVLVFLAAGYAGLAVGLYLRSCYWLPLVLPLGGALLLTHLLLVTWRAVFEQTERRRVKSVFSTIVSPKIVHELLRSKTLSLGGARREVTVLFADVRGFTAVTDVAQERAAEFVRQNHLVGAAAEECFDEQARETLATINTYLGLVADTVIQHDGTHDKFIGDCVMAFWGAPTPAAQHALSCVRAGIEAQRAVFELNQQRKAENKRREAQNQARQAAGLRPLPLLPILFLGTGINTGMVTVGLMGSGAKGMVRQGSYTVFGREVNLASRLESASGRGRIYIGETTFLHLQREEPELAATCVALPAQRLKGISAAITAYEVPWRAPGAAALEEEFPEGATAPSLNGVPTLAPDL